MPWSSAPAARRPAVRGTAQRPEEEPRAVVLSRGGACLFGRFRERSGSCACLRSEFGSTWSPVLKQKNSLRHFPAAVPDLFARMRVTHHAAGRVRSPASGSLRGLRDGQGAPANAGTGTCPPTGGNFRVAAAVVRVRLSRIRVARRCTVSRRARASENPTSENTPSPIGAECATLVSPWTSRNSLKCRVRR